MTDKTEQAKTALISARNFIRNGIDLGYIYMPDKSIPDEAHNTLPRIDAAIVALETVAADDSLNQSTNAQNTVKNDIDLKVFDDSVGDGWLSMDSSPMGSGEPVLLKLKDDLSQYERSDKEWLDRWQGLQFVGRSPHKDHELMGWQFAAPVGHGGFPNAWLAGWKPLNRSASPPDGKHEAVKAIEFALTIDDHFDRSQFLEDWLHGDYWPEFTAAAQKGEEK